MGYMNGAAPKSECHIDVLAATSTELQEMLKNRRVKSTDLVDLYLAQIENENHNGRKLNAMISVTPKHILNEIANRLDEERDRGRLRSGLHGIPITVKDNIMTGPELQMPTTVGTYALEKSIAKSNAPVVDMLIAAGAIIIGKANLSEMTGYKGFGVTTGWSALGGQTQSPYVRGGFKDGDKLLGHSAPGGSSSGSAVGVAAGFAPLALATETDGSIVQPASRAALYGLKATVGAISTVGTAPWSRVTDSIGGMAKSAEDLATLMQVLAKQNYSSSMTRSWDGLKIGFVDPKLWSFSPAICEPDLKLISQQRTEMDGAIIKMRESGAIVRQNVPLTTMDKLVLNGHDALEQIWDYDFESEWNQFLKGYRDTDIKYLTDIVQFNLRNADNALPPKYPSQQLLLIATDKSQRISAQEYKEGIKIIQEAARVRGIDKTLDDYNLDVIIGPTDGRIPTIAAAAGYPVGTMPLGYSNTNGRAFGVCIIAAAGQEGKILQAMSAWERMMTKRQVPPQLQASSRLKDEIYLPPSMVSNKEASNGEKAGANTVPEREAECTSALTKLLTFLRLR